MFFLAFRAVRGNTLGNTARPFHRIPGRGDALPPIALLGIRLEPPVDLRHHRHVPVPELPRDQLEGRAGPRHPDGPMVPGVVEPVALEPERPEPLAVRLAHAPAVEPLKDPRTRNTGCAAPVPQAGATARRPRRESARRQAVQSRAARS
jgi:hypothetical protein